MHPDTYSPVTTHPERPAATGAELRDLFAMAALHTAPADPSAWRVADWAYHVADAMLTRRRPKAAPADDAGDRLAAVCCAMLADLKRREANLAAANPESQAAAHMRETIRLAESALAATAH
jgi:hypothetical protein